MRRREHACEREAVFTFTIQAVHVTNIRSCRNYFTRCCFTNNYSPSSSITNAMDLPAHGTPGLLVIRVDESMLQPPSFHENPLPARRERRNAMISALAEGSHRAANAPEHRAASSTERPNDNTYHVLTQGRDHRRVRYGPRTYNSSELRCSYHEEREIPLSHQGYCRCHDFLFEHAYHILARSLFHDPRGHPGRLRRYQNQVSHLARRRALGDPRELDAWNNTNLIDMRRARAVAGLDTSQYDEEIARRVLEDPHGWGWLGRVMIEQGWELEVLQDGRNYVLH